MRLTLAVLLPVPDHLQDYHLLQQTGLLTSLLPRLRD